MNEGKYLIRLPGYFAAETDAGGFFDKMSDTGEHF
jgi:hypothetical protein